MKIGVVFGGASAERDVSIASGAQVFRALRDRGHDVLAIDTAVGILSEEDENRLLESRVRPIPPDTHDLDMVMPGLLRLTDSPRLAELDVLFLALHGGMGEDGTIQSVLDVLGKPYTGSRHMSSVYAMDKDASKQMFRFRDVPTPDWLMMPCTPEEVLGKLGYPVVVKPNKQGSTIGLSVVKDPANLPEAIEQAWPHDDEVMIEKFVAGRELTVGILDDRALSVGEIVPLVGNTEIFDYQSKYQSGGAREIFPADLTPAQTARVRELGLLAHRALKMQDYSRVDFRMDAEGEMWCLEVNSLPGLTATSLLPQSAAAEGISFPELCERICILARERSQ